ncbi:ATP-binding protein [Streptomyces sp. NPDC053429]|uniref:ATP-binding protein n=1 Tax=unclassified Streptomyces TaxID=2593676 RepID=UPI0034047CFB
MLGQLQSAESVDVRTVYSCRPRYAAQARETAGAFLSCLSPPPPSGTAQDVMLVVSELVTNAIRHAGRVTAVRLTASPFTLQVDVLDPSPAFPQNRLPDLTGRDGGFGWPMVQRIARSVAVRRSPQGKVVRVTLSR